MIDRYRIEGSVGEGGMAIVYRARHRELGSLHAINSQSPKRNRKTTTDTRGDFNPVLPIRMY